MKAAMAKLSLVMKKFNVSINDLGGPIPNFDPEIGYVKGTQKQEQKQVVYFTPKYLAEQLGISAKAVRARLRKHRHELPPSEHETFWMFKMSNFRWVYSVIA